MELLNIFREELSENRRDQARKFNIADIVFSIWTEDMKQYFKKIYFLKS